MEANDEALVSTAGGEDEAMEMQQQHENEEENQLQQQQSSTAAHVLDEQSLQQLMDSGSVGEDSIIAILQNEHGEPQTVTIILCSSVQLDSVIMVSYQSF